MRAAWRDSDRIDEVRTVARGWKSAGAIDGPTLAAIHEEFPARTHELAPAWRALIFILVSVAIGGVQLAVVGSASPGAPSFFVFAALLTAATELVRSSRLAGTGSDAATSFAAVMNLVFGVALSVAEGDGDGRATFTLAAAAAAFAVAAYRWGFPIYAGFASALAFVTLARFPGGRMVWLVAGTAGCVVAAKAILSRRFGPSRRQAFSAVFVVSALALYGAVNLHGWNEQVIESIRGGAKANAVPYSGPWPLFAVGTVLVPAAFLAWGIRSRRRLILGTGGVLAALTCLTFQHLARFGSAVITVFGLVLVGLALWLNRRLRRAPGESESGFTVSSLLWSESEALGPAAALAAASAAPAAPSPPDQDFTPGGGGYGGGGATGTY